MTSNRNGGSTSANISVDPRNRSENRIPRDANASSLGSRENLLRNNEFQPGQVFKKNQKLRKKKTMGLFCKNGAC